MKFNYLPTVIAIALCFASACIDHDPTSEPQDDGEVKSACTPGPKPSYKAPPLRTCLELGCPTPACLGDTNTCFCDVGDQILSCDRRLPLRLCSEIGCFDPICDEGGCYCPDETQHAPYCAITYQRCFVMECDGLFFLYEDSAVCLCTFESAQAVGCVY